MIILEEVEVIQNDWSDSLLELAALHQKNIKYFVILSYFIPLPSKQKIYV